MDCARMGAAESYRLRTDSCDWGCASANFRDTGEDLATGKYSARDDHTGMLEYLHSLVPTFAATRAAGFGSPGAAGAGTLAHAPAES